MKLRNDSWLVLGQEDMAVWQTKDDLTQHISWTGLGIDIHNMTNPRSEIAARMVKEED